MPLQPSAITGRCVPSPAPYGFNQSGSLRQTTGDFYGRGSQFAVYHDRTYQQELQLAADFGRLDFTSGFYAYRETWFTNRPPIPAPMPAPTRPTFAPRRFIRSSSRTRPTWRAMGEAHWKATDRLRLTAGLRYTWERHTNANQLY